jgi:hypothetical protein
MALDVRFEDGPAIGQTTHYAYLSVPLPSLAWTGESGGVEAVYHRSSDNPDPDGRWRYRRSEADAPPTVV